MFSSNTGKTLQNAEAKRGERACVLSVFRNRERAMASLSSGRGEQAAFPAQKN